MKLDAAKGILVGRLFSMNTREMICEIIVWKDQERRRWRRGYTSWVEAESELASNCKKPAEDPGDPCGHFPCNLWKKIIFPSWDFAITAENIHGEKFPSNWPLLKFVVRLKVARWTDFRLFQSTARDRILTPCSIEDFNAFQQMIEKRIYIHDSNFRNEVGIANIRQGLSVKAQS